MICKRSVAILALALSLVLVPAISAQPNQPLRCEVSITLDWGPPVQWDGEITGDIEGTFIIRADPAPSFPGETEHFFETWVIETLDGTIELYQEGVWSFKTFKWKSNGRVTFASGEWVYLIGSNVHVRGTTTPLTADPVTGLGTLTISINK